MEDPKKNGPKGLVLLVICVLVGVGVYKAARPIIVYLAAKELYGDETGKNALRFAASAAPLACSLRLSEKERKSFELMSEAVSLVSEKAEECGGSLAKVNRCLDKYSAELEDAVLGDIAVESDQDWLEGAVDSIERLWNRGKRTIEKAGAVYAAETHMRKSLRRAIRRAEMIETFGPLDDEAKDGVLELLNYVDGIGIGDLLKDKGNIRSEIRRRASAAKSAVARWAKKTGDKLPFVTLYMSVGGDADELFGKPEVSSIINSSPVWDAGFNKACSPKGVLESLPETLQFATALADKFAGQ
jgi:hypothetical protein